MSSRELQASLSLASIFGLRLFGMFIILPVFALHALGQPGWNLTLVGVALGAYGLTQAVLQVPFGWLSDRHGRKPVLYFGLAVFAAGELRLRHGRHPWLVIAGASCRARGRFPRSSSR
jgi:MFS family permease